MFNLFKNPLYMIVDADTPTMSKAEMLDFVAKNKDLSGKKVVEVGAGFSVVTKTVVEGM